MTTPERPVNSTPIDDLAALYALDLLEADDLARVDLALAQDETFAQRVSEFQTAAAAIPYSVPAVPMAGDLKNRLFQRIAQAPEASDSPLLDLLTRSIDDLKKQAADLVWQPMMGSNAVEIALWQTDEARREVAFFVRKSEGGLFPNHAHASGETVLVLTGDFVANGEVYRVGDRATAIAHTAHQPGTQTGCLLFCISSMDDQVLSDERSL